MADPQIERIVQKVFDILQADSRTTVLVTGQTVAWYLGRMSPLGITRMPAAGVTFAPGIRLSTVRVPSGRGGEIPVRIRLWTQNTESTAKAEEQIQNLLGLVIDVLWGSTMPLVVTGYNTNPWLQEVSVPELDTNAEAALPYAEATIIATYRVDL